jgi:hypothetical protein
MRTVVLKNRAEWIAEAVHVLVGEVDMDPAIALEAAEAHASEQIGDVNEWMPPCVALEEELIAYDD